MKDCWAIPAGLGGPGEQQDWKGVTSGAPSTPVVEVSVEEVQFLQDLKGAPWGAHCLCVLSLCVCPEI